MRKFPKAFQRRKSTANAFEEVENGSPVEPSFKVFERPDAAGRSFDGGVKFPKPAPSGPGRPKKPQNLDDNMFENLGNNRWVLDLRSAWISLIGGKNADPVKW